MEHPSSRSPPLEPRPMSVRRLIRLTSPSWLAFVATTLLLASPVLALTLDFEEFSHGDIVHGSQGVSIAITNLGGGPNLGVAFDTTTTGNSDDDLQINSGWSGGNLAPNTNLGKVLIIQESAWGCNATRCRRPDDEGSRPAGRIELDYSALGSFTSFSMDIVDVESTSAEPGGVVFHLGAVQVASVSFMDFLDDPSVVFGNNSANHVEVLSGISFDRVTIRMGGSGAIDNVTAAVPEPGAALLFAMGALTVGTRVRRRTSR